MAERIRRCSMLRGMAAGAGGVLAGSLLAGLLGAGALAGFAGPVAAAGSATVITVAHNKTWGSILVLGNGDAVYRLTTDPTDKSTCTGACAVAWPPVVLAAGQDKPIGRGVSGLGTITRAGGARQVTYQGIPLYSFVGDHGAGQVNGNVKDAWGQWWVVNPAHPHAVPAAAGGSGKSSGAKTPGSTSSGVAY